MNNFEKPRAVAVVRTANTYQAHKNTALENQQLQIQMYADALNVEIVQWVELGTEKYNFLKVFDACYSNSKVSQLLVTDVTRLTRNIHYFKKWKKELDDIGVDIVAVNSPETSGTATAEFMQNLMVVFAEYHSAAMSERVKRGLRNKKLRQKAITK